jgi:predicted lactoylglutathione lyase
MNVIGYITLGTNNLEKNAKFYDSLFAEIGAKRTMEGESFILWSTGSDKPGFAITKPFDGNTATVGNGVMIAIALDSPDQVDALYSKAIELGAADEGPSGPRGEGFYAGFFRDLDGNKLNFFCITS